MFKYIKFIFCVCMSKGQYALEYLITYGWALVAIVIIIIVLFAFGILNPNTFQGSNCSGFGRIGYIDHALSGTDGEFKITLANGEKNHILADNATVSIDEDRDGTFDATAANDETWFGSTENTFTLSVDSIDSGSRYTVNLKIEYEAINSLAKEETAICSGLAN